jgi:Zn-finger in ubiquitin-hydrolases and other protein
MSDTRRGGNSNEWRTAMAKLTELLFRAIYWRPGKAAKQCTHLREIRVVTPSSHGCEDCLKIGDTWVHLRICRICGHVGCCDNSKNKHATKHFHVTGHPIIQSFEPEEDWMWCYVDEVILPAHVIAQLVV